MAWKRARQPEQKEQRRRAILDAAARLYEKRDLEDISLNEIAREAGMAKSNVYRYFETREEIFLHLYMADITAWGDEVIDALKRPSGENDPEYVAGLLAGTIARNPRLIGLLSRLSSVVERNLSADVVADFKRSLWSFMKILQGTLHDALPGLGMEQAGRFLLHLHALGAGLWPMTNPGPVVDEVLGRPEFEGMRMDFEIEFETAVSMLLRGFMTSKDG